MKHMRVGIDIGALFVKAVKINDSGQVLGSFYQAHKGDPQKAVEECLRQLQVQSHEAISMTGSAADLLNETLGVPQLDMTQCQIEAIRQVCPGVTYIMDIGGASATLIQLDSHGKLQSYSTNSLCAAGTGSFLDEQSSRLGISYSDAESFGLVEQPPTVATRCSVFAKSDLIHRQQQGYSKADMWSGLCRGMTRTLLGTLLSGRPLDGPAAVIGGVAQNREVLRWLEQTCPGLIRVPPKPHLVAALGAARMANKPASKEIRPVQFQQKDASQDGRYSWPLTLQKSIYPSFETLESYSDAHGSEIRIVLRIEPGTLRGFLGIDIGSTSTKLALVNESDRVVLDIYRKTGGDPIGATKLLFGALSEIQRNKDVYFDIRGVGTTGSGRKLVGAIIGADAVLNEISAHVAGAVYSDPSIDTIFEIGGQDSKYMHIKNGHIRDANMNYVCAAGTGSFVEEQANKLGYPVDKVGAAVLGIRPPRTSDRCTVFMEQDVARLVQQGASQEEAMAGVMVSVVKNYLNKVVGNRYRSRNKIFFQGATARNPALVAAFERVLGVPMVVSPYCHVMGAFGVALLTRQLMTDKRQERSSFRGLDLENRSVSLRSESCDLCQNHCNITFADIQGEEKSPSWGYLCGRDPDEHKVRSNPREKPLRIRQKLWRESGLGVSVPKEAPVVGIPQALTTYTYLPLWQRFFNHLGYNVQLSGPTTQEIRELGTRINGAEFCFPAKVALGHVASLAMRDGVDFVFVPHMVSETKNEYWNAAKFCPYVQALPSFAQAALSLNGIRTARLLSPVVDLRVSPSRMVDLLSRCLSGPLQRSRREIRRAWKDGMSAQGSFERSCKEEGQKILDEAVKRSEKILVLVGRPYNNFDTGLNLGLPQKIAEQGRTVIPLDMLNADVRDLKASFQNIYWNYGQRILAGVKKIAAHDNLDAVYLTNFNCGPDSFLLTYCEDLFGDQPFLSLELDEHGADAGYLTRIEAFFDVLRRQPHHPPSGHRHRDEPKNLRDRVVWIPPMHPLGPSFVAAAFRSAGYDSRPLLPENRESFELGRGVTRGAECLPTALTIGILLQTLKKEGPGKRHAFFMPTAEGPCRFGQYCTLHRRILDREGLSDVALLSPSSFNSYQGIDEFVRRRIVQGLLAADVLFKAVLKIRPYEIHPGETNQVLAEQQHMIENTLESDGNVFLAVGQAVRRIASIPVSGPRKPLVGVVGEIYVRCNTFANEDVIGAIERFGGEAWLAPMFEWVLYTAATQSISFWDRSRNILAKWVADLKNIYLYSKDHQMYAAAGPFLADRHEPPIRQVIEEGTKYFPANFEGESILTVGRSIWFARQGAALVVNCAPFGCMPGTITTAVFRKVAPELGIPVVNMFYDGHGNQNARLQVFLNNAISRQQSLPPPSRQAPWTTPSRDRRAEA